MEKEDAKNILEELKREKIAKGAEATKLIKQDKKHGTDFLESLVRREITGPSLSKDEKERKRLLEVNARKVIKDKSNNGEER